MSKSESDYSLQTKTGAAIAAPVLPYLPPKPKSFSPKIALIGCGGITASHLRAYREQGYSVAALCDKDLSKAEARKAEFFPEAELFTHHADILGREDIEVLDIATHPPERVPLIQDALAAGKHVLSQKPFVLDLDTGEELVALAERTGRKLAINQNGRWAPHFSYMRQAIQAGLIGDVLSSHLQVHWDHTWIKDTPFENIHDVVLYDFAIHWFDITTEFFAGRRAKSVYATKTQALGQSMAPPMLAQALIEYEGGQASLVFDAHLKFGPQDHSYVGGTAGSLISTGPGLGNQSVTLFNNVGEAKPELEGSWFPGGFAGTMGELLCAIEENREPSNSARNNLKSLELCFAAIASSFDGQPKVPGEVRKLPEGSAPLVTVGTR